MNQNVQTVFGFANNIANSLILVNSHEKSQNQQHLKVNGYMAFKCQFNYEDTANNHLQLPKEHQQK